MRKAGEEARSTTEVCLFPAGMKKISKCESIENQFSPYVHVSLPVILKRSFHLIRLSWLIKIQQFAHCFFRSGEASWKMQAEGFCVGDNKWDDFLNPSLSSSIRDK